MAKKKFNWKKFKKKALKANKKIGKWVNTNINPDVLSGNADRIFAPQGEFGIQGIDWESEMFGSKPKKRRRR